ncbi:Gfo/Idh/MocA family protein [Mariniblastus fucicola]|uniref:Inositol 2-dehydrogenase n=1 Tax=Mariniblastus fucicola TaxID=980251 RepID=A0A5B9P8A3_9BACT|nr:Gfo/Idh/MocA family oxidoreductase [Mariniblastus fucicola]QEG22574.1 Inositol 2-dehydrogenase [Mariniblastus fucicola]
MADKKKTESKPTVESACDESRRGFLKTGTAAGAAAAVGLGAPSLSLARSANAAGRDTIKLGLIGGGGRGRGASIQAMNTASGNNVELHAIADVFEKNADIAIDACSTEHDGKVKVTDDTKFIGLDAYKRVLDSDVDMVILATPPGFRPLHFEKAIDAGKHVFMEKPVGVDAPGIRRVLAAGEKAREKKLMVQVGLQRRHEPIYKDTIKQLQDGIIGDLLVSRVYWNNNGVWNRPRDPRDNELEYQLRNWYYFNWLCGDHIVEQHIHNLDVINWLMEDYPVKAQGQGGRLVRTGRKNGEIFDHHAVEYTYGNGHKMFSFCRHMPKCWSAVTEFVHGSNGWAHLSEGKIYDKDDKLIFEAEYDPKKKHDGWQQEHHDLFAAIEAGQYVNEAEYGAKSTFTAIFGRLATYSGKEISWDKCLAEGPSLANVDELTSFDMPAPCVPKPDGSYEVPVPGAGASTVLGYGNAKKKAKG